MRVRVFVQKDQHGRKREPRIPARRWDVGRPTLSTATFASIPHAYRQQGTELKALSYVPISVPRQTLTTYHCTLRNVSFLGMLSGPGKNWGQCALLF